MIENEHTTYIQLELQLSKLKINISGVLPKLQRRIYWPLSSYITKIVCFLLETAHTSSKISVYWKRNCGRNKFKIILLFHAKKYDKMLEEA